MTHPAKKWTLTILLILGIPGAALAQQTPADSRILFTNVNVFDGVNEQRIGNAFVLVEGNLIKQVSTEPITAGGATVIDGGGRAR